MKRKTIQAQWLQTISWLDDKIVDWPSARTIYSQDGKIISSGGETYGFFDSVVSSPDNQYAFAYKRLGTKGLLLKNGKLIREINRSYYCSELYEYPATFVKVDGITYLIHCPLAYNRIDFEDVATGELITNIPGRDSSDAFHSRLEVSPCNTYLMSKGWYWHPRDFVEVFDIKSCMQNPLLLDHSFLSPDTGVEINTASFINDSQVVIGSSDEPYDEERTDNPLKYIGIWDFIEDKVISNVKVKGEFGNLFAINEQYAWDMFKYPKVIDITTGDIVDKDESVFSGNQTSSMIGKDTPQIAYNRATGQIAVAHNNIIDNHAIEIFSTDIR